MRWNVALLVLASVGAALSSSADAQQAKSRPKQKARATAAAPVPPPSPYTKWGITATELHQATGPELLAKAGFPARLAAAQQAADAGDAVAQVLVSLAYLEGYGASKDYALARRYAELAAGAMQPRAVHTMGLLYQNGWGLKRDRKAADVWFAQERQLLGAAPGATGLSAAKATGAQRGGLLAGLTSSAIRTAQPPSTSQRSPADETSAAAQPAPPAYPTTKCNQPGCWGGLAQIEGTRFSYNDWMTSSSGWIRYDWAKPGQVLRVTKSFLGNAPGSWNMTLDPKTRMPSGYEVLADGSLASGPAWVDGEYIRSLIRIAGDGRYEEVIQAFKDGRWADKKHFLGLGTYKQAYRSDAAIRERAEARSQFWGNVAQAGVAVSRGIAEQQAHDADLNAIRAAGMAQTSQIIANAQKAQQQQRAREVEAQRLAEARQQAEGRAALTRQLAEANAYRERQIAQSKDPAERARLADVSRRAIADTQRQLGPAAAAEVQAQTRAIVARQPSGGNLAQLPPPPAQDSAPMKLGPRPPKGVGNCDPGPCRNPVAPPPPIRLERNDRGPGSSGPAGAASDPYPLMLSNDKCDKAIQPTLERTQQVVEMKGGGDWFRWDGRITQKGYMAVACFIHPHGREYFVVQGYATAGDAVRGALELARRAKGERDSRFWVTSAGAPYLVK